MKVPTHLPFIILVVSTIHAVIITIIWPRGPRLVGPSGSSPAVMTTGYIDEEALEPELAANTPADPMNLMITEEEIVNVPEKAHDHEGEMILKEAAYLFPSQERPISHPSVEKTEQPEKEGEEILVASLEQNGLYQAPRPVNPEEIETVADDEVNEPASVEVKVKEEPAPKTEEPKPVVKETVQTSPDDIEAELTSLEIDDPLKDKAVSDSAVAAAMKMWEEQKRVGQPTSPAVPEEVTAPVARPIRVIDVKTEPTVISPPPIP